MALRRARLAFVRDVVAFGEEHLALQFDGSFRRFVARHRTANWLYAVEPDRFESCLPGRATFTFAWDRAKLRRMERRFRARGKHTYLFSAEAHGGRACPVTPALLAASRARQAYVVLHEAWHSTLRTEGIQMPYALEEATGRVVGVMGAVLLAERRRDAELLHEAREQARAWGAMARFVNRSYARMDRIFRSGAPGRERTEAWRAIRAEARALRARTISSWEREELGRPVDNAFLFRYHDYTRLYPLAFSVWRNAGSLPVAMRLYKRAGRTGAPDALKRFLAGR